MSNILTLKEASDYARNELVWASTAEAVGIEVQLVEKTKVIFFDREGYVVSTTGPDGVEVPLDEPWKP